MNRSGLVCFLLGVLLTCSVQAEGIGSRADREALYDWLFKKTFEREAFSEIKNERLGIDVAEQMRACRADIIDASDEIELFYALAKLSAARCDRHLSVEEIPGGLSLDSVFEALAKKMGHASDDDLIAPLRFKAGFENINSPTIFVSAVANPSSGADLVSKIGIADQLVSVNGMPLEAFAAEVRPYWRYSTIPNFWSRLARDLNSVTRAIPPRFYRPRLELELKNKSGATYSVSLPYFKEADLRWDGSDERQYPGFKLREDFVSFDIYEPTNGQNIILLQWYGFREDLVASVDSLMEIAVQEDWLDHDLIIDLTLSRGGSKGAYAIQRLSPRPFRTTFGNLRLSDAALKFSIAALEKQRRGSQTLDGGITETIDDGSWLTDWLCQDVLIGYAAGQRYSNNVPFKCAHAPRTSDGTIRPAKQHFRGRMVCWFSPHGGSHLDQFASIFRDNRLGHSIGMPTGGYSNTWEAEEHIGFPTTGEPLVMYMWSIGHTVRPNGEVLEGNPADVDEWFPMTRGNYQNYYQQLLDKSIKYLNGSARQARAGNSHGGGAD